MFSRTEREFLRLLGEGPVASRGDVVRARFPNPVYRRKLLWGIRRKAAAAAADWTLYTRAAEREARVVRPSPGEREAIVPRVTEPFAGLFLLLAQARASRARSGPRGRR